MDVPLCMSHTRRALLDVACILFTPSAVPEAMDSCVTSDSYATAVQAMVLESALRVGSRHFGFARQDSCFCLVLPISLIQFPIPT